MKTRILTLVLGFAMLTFSTTQAQDIEKGKKTFKTICAACHTIGKGKLVGPDLKGVTDRLETDWLKAFIKNSTEVIESGDEYAVAIHNEYNKIPMPANPTFTDEDLDNLLAYITDASTVKEEPKPAVNSTPASGKEVANPAQVVITQPADSVIDNPLIRMVFWGSVFIIIAVLVSLTMVFVNLSNNK